MEEWEFGCERGWLAPGTPLLPVWGKVPRCSTGTVCRDGLAVVRRFELLPKLLLDLSSCF